jgi:CelD/BcsL family acetyltransferase involved in cellulose biosynthesis
MPGLIRLCAARRWLRMGIAYHENVPVAAQLWIVNAGRAAIYKLAYDQAFARLSAGTVLTARLMRQVIDEERVDEVDYLVGDDDYKKDWMTHRRARLGIVAYDWRHWRGLGGMLLQGIGQARRRLAGISETGR